MTATGTYQTISLHWIGMTLARSYVFAGCSKGKINSMLWDTLCRSWRVHSCSRSVPLNPNLDGLTLTYSPALGWPGTPPPSTTPPSFFGDDSLPAIATDELYAR